MNKIFTKKNIGLSLNNEEGKKSNVEPTERTIQNILNYSKALVVKKSKSINYFEFILN